MSLGKIFTVLLSVSLLGSVVARADKHERPCKADFEKFCKDVKGAGQ